MISYVLDSGQLMLVSVGCLISVGLYFWCVLLLIERREFKKWLRKTRQVGKFEEWKDDQ